MIALELLWLPTPMVAVLAVGVALILRLRSQRGY